MRIDRRIIFIFGKIMKQHGKTLVESWFVGLSLILDLSVSFSYLSRIHFGGWGTSSRSLRCLKEHVPFGCGGPLPGPQGV